MMRVRAFAAAAVLVLSGLSASAQVVSYNPGAAASGSTTVAANFVATGLSATGMTGSGISPLTTGTSFRASGFTTQAAPSTTSAYTFSTTTLTAGTYNFTGASFTFSGFSSADNQGDILGPQSFALLRSVNGAAATQVGATQTVTTSPGSYTIDLSSLGTIAVPSGTTYTFSLSGFNAGNSGTNATFDLTGTTVVGGTFTPVPEPLTVGLVGVAGLGFVRLRRRFV